MNRRNRIIAILQAVSKGRALPGDDESLFDAEVLDSFALVDFVTALEEGFGLKIPDSDVNPGKFETVEKIDAYLERRGLS